VVTRRYARKIAQAVVDRINAAGIGITARREYASEVPYEHLNTLRCSVQPMRFGVEALSRAVNDWQRVISVTLSKRLEGDETARIDDQGDLIEAIAELWVTPDERTVTIDADTVANLIEIEADYFLEEDDLREKKIARTQLLLTFRMVY
jgi:hypothetical protein